MADLPVIRPFTTSVITPCSINSIGVEIAGNSGGAESSAAWAAANLAIYIPFRIAIPTTIVKIYWLNGASAGTDSVDVGIYDSQQNRLVSSGSTITSGTNAIQSVDITDTTLQQGLYYMAMAMNGTTNPIFQITSGTTVPMPRAMGVLEQATAFALPSTATFTGSTHSSFPWICLALGTTL